MFDLCVNDSKVSLVPNASYCAALAPVNKGTRVRYKHWHTSANTGGLYKRPINNDNSAVGHRCLLVEHENLRLSHFKFNLLKTSGRRITKPIANKFVLYLKLHQGSWLVPKAMRYQGAGTW